MNGLDQVLMLGIVAALAVRVYQITVDYVRAKRALNATKPRRPGLIPHSEQINRVRMLLGHGYEMVSDGRISSDLQYYSAERTAARIRVAFGDPAVLLDPVAWSEGRNKP